MRPRQFISRLWRREIPWRIGLETAVLAIAPPTQREASMTPRAWPPGPPDGQASRTPPESPEPDSNRRPAAYEAAALPLGHRGLDGPSHRFFQCMMRVCPHGCLVRRATGGTVWWSRRDSDPRPSCCERDALPLRHGPVPSPPSMRGRGQSEKESLGWRHYAAGALGRIRTGDAHLRRVALYPLSYGGLRRPALAWVYAPAALIPYP